MFDAEAIFSLLLFYFFKWRVIFLSVNRFTWNKSCGFIFSIPYHTISLGSFLPLVTRPIHTTISLAPLSVTTCCILNDCCRSIFFCICLFSNESKTYTLTYSLHPMKLKIHQPLCISSIGLVCDEEIARNLQTVYFSAHLHFKMLSFMGWIYTVCNEYNSVNVRPPEKKNGRKKIP